MLASYFSACASHKDVSCTSLILVLVEVDIIQLMLQVSSVVFPYISKTEKGDLARALFFKSNQAKMSRN